VLFTEGFITTDFKPLADTPQTDTTSTAISKKKGLFMTLIMNWFGRKKKGVVKP
jgi:hypothetical protein